MWWGIVDSNRAVDGLSFTQVKTLSLSSISLSWWDLMSPDCSVCRCWVSMSWFVFCVTGEATRSLVFDILISSYSLSSATNVVSHATRPAVLTRNTQKTHQNVRNDRDRVASSFIRDSLSCFNANLRKLRSFAPSEWMGNPFEQSSKTPHFDPVQIPHTLTWNKSYKFKRFSRLWTLLD